MKWAIEGWHILRNKEHRAFAETEAGKKVVERMAMDGSSLRQFIADECVLEEDAYVIKKDLYARYKTWCESNGGHPMSSGSLGGNVREAVQPAILDDSRRKAPDGAPYYGKQEWGFVNIRLKTDAEKGSDDDIPF
jgi:putative DNA primase/helicase